MKKVKAANETPQIDLLYYDVGMLLNERNGLYQEKEQWLVEREALKKEIYELRMTVQQIQMGSPGVNTTPGHGRELN